MSETAILLQGISIDNLLNVSLSCSFDPLKQSILLILQKLQQNETTISALTKRLELLEKRDLNEVVKNSPLVQEHEVFSLYFIM